MDLLKELKTMPMTLDLLQVSCTVMVKTEVCIWMSSKCCLNKLNRFPHISCLMQRIKINIKSNKTVQKLGFGWAIKELWTAKRGKTGFKVANTEGSLGRSSL